MNQEMQIIREVSAMAETLYEDAVALGDHAANAFQSEKRTDRNNHRSQMTGLENIAEGTYKVGDVLDYIKKQTARHKSWQRGYPKHTKPDEGFGERLKNYLEQSIPGRRDVVCTRTGIGKNTYDDQLKRQHVYLLLIRQFVRHMVVQYEYKAELEMHEGEHGRARQ